MYDRWRSKGEQEVRERGESIVQKPPEIFNEAILTQNKDALAEFMDQPLPAIVETVTGFLTSPKSWMPMTGHIVQGLLKGKLFPQVAQEIRDLREKGKIPEDFADKRYGFQSWVELLQVIDDETPDVEKLDALKAMFYSVNKIGIDDGERVLGYQLFQIAKRLSSNQLLILKTVYENQGGFGMHNSQGLITWAQTIALKLGHKLSYLILKDEPALVEHGLIMKRHSDAPGMDFDERQSRLTDLGNHFCENIRKYHIETKT